MRGIPGVAFGLPSVHYIVDAATATARWTGAASGAQTRYTEGVQSTQKDPPRLAVAAQSKLVANFNNAVNSGKWARELSAVSQAAWKQATVDKAQNYSTGINASAGKYQAAIAPVLAFEAQLQQQIDAMPNVTLQDSIARMTAWATGLYNRAQQGW